MRSLDRAIHYDQVYSVRAVDLWAYGSRATHPPSMAAPYRHSERLISSLVRSGSKVLDLGCGIGRFSIFPALAGATTIGLDISPVSAAVAGRRGTTVAPGASLGFLAGDGQMLPFADGTFDLVTSYGVLSYLDRDVALAEIRRVLKPGGSAVIVDRLPGSPPLRWWRQLVVRSGGDTQQNVDNILTLDDIETMRRHFDRVEIVSLHGLTTLLSASLRRFPRMAEAVDVPLRALDAALLRLPFARRWAWKAVLHLRVD